jgi:hypothetical protein
MLQLGGLGVMIILVALVWNLVLRLLVNALHLWALWSPLSLNGPQVATFPDAEHLQTAMTVVLLFSILHLGSCPCCRWMFL